MLPSGLPEFVSDQEDIARFLTQSNRFNSIMARPAAFLPRPNEEETSVCRHGREPLERLWEFGLAAAGERPLYGAAIFRAAVARAAKLDIVADEPPDRHAVINGWPFDNDPDLQRARRKELAALLASAAGEPVLR